MKTIRKKQMIQILDQASRPVRWIWSRRPEALIGLVSIGAIIFCLLTYSPAVANFASRLLSGNKWIALADGLFNPFRNRSALLKSGLPIYNLKIGRQRYATLEKVAEEARKKGWMSDDLKVWVNAKFIHEDREYNVKVRIRGDMPNHWSGPKKSWRVKFGKQKLNDNGKIIKERVFFNGKRQINLIIPQDRRLILAYFINSLMREAGLVVPRDRFVILRINGVLQGLYYEVEHFDKPLLAANRRPETTVFGQSDRVMHFEKYTKYGIPTAADARYDIGSMRRSVDRDGQLAMRAMQVLIDHSLNPTDENFSRVRQVLDWEKYLRFRVITTLCNTNHVRFGSDNLRLYYDTSRGLLEPIPWDVHLVRLPKEPGTIDFWNSHGPDEIQKATLRNPALRLQRNKILWEMFGDGGTEFMSKFNAIYERMRPIAWADVLITPVQGHRMDVLKKTLDYNVKRIYKVLSLSSANLTYSLQSEDRASLEFTTLNFSGIRLQGLNLEDSVNFAGQYRLYEDDNRNGKFDEEDLLLAETVAQNGVVDFVLNKYVLPGVKYNSDYLDDGRYWEFFDTVSGRSRLFLIGKLATSPRNPLEWNPPKIQVSAQNAVSGKAFPSSFISQREPLPADSLGITAYDASAPFDLDAPNDTLEKFLAKHPQFSPSSKRPGAVELDGEVIIAGTIIVPKHVPLILNPGVDITMESNANILCYGGLTALGEPNRPVRIHGNDKGEIWGTFAVVRSPEKVRLTYTEFRDGGQALVNGILFTGGFAVHDADLELRDCRFVNMQGEDGVNLKNGSILMVNCRFVGNASDGIDIDFGTGSVRNSQFINIGGDGLDLSGSKIRISDSLFENIKDKGISVGEDSHPVVINNLFKNNAIAISTKDLSFAKVANCTFVNNKLAIEAKRKKAMFGPGSGEFVNCVFADNETLLQEDYFSRGRVTINHSVADQSLDEPNEKTVFGPIQFAAPERQNYLLAASFVKKNGIDLAFPLWYQKEINVREIEYPGIYTAIAASKSKSYQLP
jgi:hypothetical protein